MNTTTKKAFIWIIIIGLFTLPFVPFIITRSMLFPFITGKGFYFRITAEIIFALWALVAIADPAYRPKWNAITKSILVFLGIVFLADLFSVYSFKSFWSNYERMEGFVTIIHLVAYYFVISTVFRTQQLWKWFWNTVLLGSVAECVYGFLQLTGHITINQGGVRLDGTFGNSAYLAIYSIFCIFIALIMLFKEKDKVWKWAYGVVVFLNGIILYYTATRGSILGLIGGILLASIIVAWRERNNKVVRKFAAGLLIAIIVLTGVFVAVRNSSFVQHSPVLSRFASLSFSDPETQARYYVWAMALKGAEQRPILGWGQESFNYVFNANYNPAMYNQEQWFDRTHDIFLDWLINAGVLGLLAYISLFATLLYLLWKRTQFSLEEKALFTGLMAAYVFHNMFVFDNMMSYILFFSILGYVSSQATYAKSDKPVTMVSSETFNYFCLPVVAIALVACIYFVNVPAIEASTTLIQAISKQDSVQTNYDDFVKVFAYNSFGSPEALEQLVNITIQVISSQSDPTLKQDFYTLADQQIKAQIARTPMDARYLLLAGSFYNSVGQYTTAIPYLNDAIKYSPNKPAMYFALANSYDGTGDTAKALDLATQAYNLETASPDSQIQYAVAAIYSGNQAIIAQMFSLIGQSTLISDNRILEAYIGIKDYASAEDILQTRLTAAPTDYNTELQLASIYATAGDKAKAIALIKDVEAKNPGSNTELDPYIQQLSQ